MKEDQLPEVYEIVTKYGKKGRGYGEQEFASFEDFKEKFWNRADDVMALIDNKGCLIIAGSLMPSELCRSTKPLFRGSYLIKNPEIKQKDIRTLVDLYQLNQELAISHGYVGFLGRSSTTFPPYFTSRHSNPSSQVILTARIPCSTYSKERGWLDDVVSHIAYQPITMKVIVAT